MLLCFRRRRLIPRLPAAATAEASMNDARFPPPPIAFARQDPPLSSSSAATASLMASAVMALWTPAGAAKVAQLADFAVHPQFLLLLLPRCSFPLLPPALALKPRRLLASTSFRALDR